MNSKILNSIYYGELKPWLITFDNERELKETIRAVSKMPFASISDYENRLKVLLQQLPSLQHSFSALQLQILQPLHYSTSLPEPSTLPQHFYKAIIEAEKIRYYNETLANPFIKDNALDVPYQIGEKSLKGIAILANELNNVLVQKDIDNTDLTYFTLLYLRNSLIELFFSIQEQFKEHLSNVYDSFADFALYCLDENTLQIELTQKVIQKETTSIASSNNEAFNFGFKGDVDKLKNLIKVLCVHKNLLNEQLTSQEHLFELLTTKDINTKNYQIHFGCNTNLMTYILISFKKNFPKMTFANIGRSEIFITDNNTLVKASLLSNSKSNNDLSKQTKVEIDKIFKENDM